MINAWKTSALLASLIVATVSSADDSIVRTYESPNGETYASVSIRHSEVLNARENVDHVVLIDTSASQVGEHRQIGFDVLKSFLSNLPAGHRAMVVAMDMKAVPLNDGFADPRHASKIALQELESRFPAGASNFGLGIDVSLKALENSKAGSITYIGDGMSAAELILVDDLKARTQKLVDRQIPVHSFAVGSNLDMQLLGVLGQETGGFVMRDESSENSLNGKEAGQLLAQAATASVIYPEAVAVSSDQVELLPNRPLPMRADRETVYLLQGAIDSTTELQIGQTRSKITKARADGNTFLYHLWSQTEEHDGLTLGLAGDWMVNLAHDGFEKQIAQLELQGANSLNANDYESAEKIGFQIQSIDPQNVRARQLIHQAGEMQLTQTVQFEAPAFPQEVEEPTNLDDRTQPRGEDAITKYQQLVDANTQRLRREVETQIEQARGILNEDPDVASEILNQARGAIKSEQNVDPEVRNQLLRRIADEQQNAISQREVILLRLTEGNRQRSEIEAQRRLIDFTAERDRQLEQMVDRVRSLILQGYQGDPGAFESAEAVGREILSEYPGNAMGVSTTFMAEAAGQLDKVERLRNLRSDRFLATLYEVELAHVPFPDEPPIVYPPAEVWAALTEARKKWRSVDLRNNSPNEQKIYEALDKVTTFEFPGNPLTDVVDFIRVTYNIPIIFDDTELNEEGISTDEEVSLVISGITLESALKLLLEKLDLTYVIEDEVMKITTTFAAGDIQTTRVYSVGDLVMPIPLPLTGGGGGLGGGIGGGLGGGGGGLGGGGLGGGGGFGGGGLGGGGGGFFSIPAEPVDGKKKPLLK